MKKLTIVDIAKLCGISKSTVSRVLNNDVNVKEETRQKVLKIIKENNFTPSNSARILRGKETKTIGIVTTRLDSSAENRAIRGILEQFDKIGYDVVLVESLFSIKKTKQHVENLLKRNVDGFIIFAIGNGDYDFMSAINKPVIMIGQEVQGFNSIVYDDYGAINKICNYLWTEGEKSMAYIGIGESDPTSGAKRSNAYNDFVKEKGIKNINFTGDLSYEGGYKLAEKCIKEQVNVIICATDNIALGVRKFLYERGITNIKVAGIGNNKLVKFIFPEHISVRLFYKNSGVKAAQMLDDIIRGNTIKETIVIHSELCI